MILPAIILALMAQDAELTLDDTEWHRIEDRGPIYPAGRWQRGIVAACQASFSVNSQGRTEDYCIACVSTYEHDHPRNVFVVNREFEHSVRDMLRDWRYQPGEPRTGLVTEVIYSVGENDNPPPDVPPLSDCHR